VDIIIYSLLIYLTRALLRDYILLSTAAARVVSSLYNYYVNKKVVFSGNRAKNTLLKYYLLAAIQMFTSGYLTTLLFNAAHWGEVPSKILVDTILFLISFFVQREWIFAKY
jgi:putative flippase GtrA